MAQQDKKEGKDKTEDQLYEERRMLGEESPKQDIEHGRPIEPGPTLIPPIGGGKAVLLGNNADRGSAGKMNTDLPGGLAEAKAMFEQMTREQDTTTTISDRGVTLMMTPDGTMLRINADGGVRIERPIEIGDRTREVIHFKGQ